MTRIITRYTLLILLFSLTQQLTGQVKEYPNDDRRIQNIAAFAKVYGVARFFYPSAGAQDLNWKEFLVYGVNTVKTSKNNSELKQALEKLFKPIAQHISFTDTRPGSLSNMKFSQGDRIIFWQHENFSNMGENKGAGEIGKLVFAKYDSSLVIRQGNPYTIPEPNYARVEYYNFDRFFNENNYFLSRNTDQYLLNIQPDPSSTYVAEIASGLWINSPIVLSAKKQNHLSTNESTNQISEVVNGFFKKLKSNNEDIFYADFIYCWSIVNHFYPYRKRAETLLDFRWEDQLIPGLRGISSAKNVIDAMNVIRKSIQLFQDPHSDLYTRAVSNRRWLPFETEIADNRIFVVKTIDPKISKGDEILEIGGKKVKYLLDSLSQLWFGPERRQQVRALRSLGFNQTEQMPVKLKRNQQQITVNINTIPHKEYMELKFPVNLYEHKAIEQVSPKTFYINLGLANERELLEQLPEFINADNLIFDLRDYPNSNEVFYRHLIKKDFGRGLIGSSPVNMSPDQNLSYYIFSMALKIPEKPIIQAKISVLINAATISRGETVTSMLKEQGAVLFGETTAGASGGINWFTTPSKITFQLTTSYFVRQNLQEMQIVGIKPDFFVVPGVKELQEGKDAVLETVLKRLKSK